MNPSQAATDPFRNTLADQSDQCGRAFVPPKSCCSQYSQLGQAGFQEGFLARQKLCYYKVASRTANYVLQLHGQEPFD